MLLLLLFFFCLQVNYLYRLIGTWGLVLRPQPWRQFRGWYHTVRMDSTFKPYTAGASKLTGWYKTFEKVGATVVCVDVFVMGGYKTFEKVGDGATVVCVDVFVMGGYWGCSAGQTPLVCRRAPPGCGCGLRSIWITIYSNIHIYGARIIALRLAYARSL